MHLNYSSMIILGLVLGLAGCDKGAEPSKPQSAGTGTVDLQPQEPEIPPRHQDFQQVLRGGRIYQQNCATCHGKLAQGAPNWRQRDANGKYPAPPLTGDGLTWHHPMKVLVNTVKNGTIPLGGSMPAWGDKLSEQDIRDVLAWVQAQWPDEIYARWYQRNQEAENRK